MDVNDLLKAELWDRLEPISHQDKFALGISKINLFAHFKDKLKEVLK